MSRECTTHHFACDCREAHMGRMRRALEAIAERDVPSKPGWEGYRHVEAMGMQVLAQYVLEGGDPDDLLNPDTDG